METYTDLEPFLGYEPTPEDEHALAVFQRTETLPTNIESKIRFVNAVKESILEYGVNPLEYLKVFKLVTDGIEEIKKDEKIKEIANEELNKHPKSKAVINGAILSPGSKRNFNYESCNDKKWVQLKEELKKREEFLKALPKEGLKTVDEETGEEITLMPPTFTTSEWINVSLK